MRQVCNLLQVCFVIQSCQLRECRGGIVDVEADDPPDEIISGRLYFSDGTKYFLIDDRSYAAIWVTG